MVTMQSAQRFRYGNLPAVAPNRTSGPVPPSEVILLDRCKSGDRDAWDTLIHRYEKAIHDFAYSRCRNHEEAEDIAGHVLLRLYQSLHTFRHEASFTCWLIRIVHNTYLDMCVRPIHRNHISLDARPTADAETFAVLDLMDPAPTPEKVCLENETARQLTRAIRHLPQSQCQVLHMYHAEGKSYGEIEEELDLPIGTVKSRLNRARNLLRKCRDDDEDMSISA
jgi:RNA polymerase sigma-70 factor (ECF subfamily)